MGENRCEETKPNKYREGNKRESHACVGKEFRLTGQLGQIITQKAFLCLPSAIV
jgi:hypothetical protein